MRRDHNGWLDNRTTEEVEKTRNMKKKPHPKAKDKKP